MQPGSKIEPLDISNAGRVPAHGDNTAIAIRTLPAGTRILLRQIVFEFAYTVLEGHRFAVFPIRKGQQLLSWGLPFGVAVRDIEPGEYVCNEKILRALSGRVDFPLPSTPNFLDDRASFVLDEAHFTPGVQVNYEGNPPTFLGFPRGHGRGAGTRNYIVVIGTSARTGAFARALAGRFQEANPSFPNVSGVVAVDHTEGGAESKPLNFELTLRTLAGFMVNPNVGAVLCVDFGNEAVCNAALAHYLQEHRYPTAALPHRFLSICDGYEAALEEGARQIESWLPRVNQFTRQNLPVFWLYLGLQCGGSDAFSGVSGNPLAGLLSRDVVAWGGRANLAETSELIGAESFVLKNVRDLQTAKDFLQKRDRFREWASWHGHSPEGNPSGGNMYRGLYNISIKSIGAARKKDPATRLDWVIDFAERMQEPGFYFMDSPGNDLESIAGQVAAGCNMIIFSTGNGSITNFPFVPTIKIMTTTRRFELVRKEMDFNAGRYLDGEDLEALGKEAFEYLRGCASGQLTAGEHAGHAQVQLWREWRRNSGAVNTSDESKRVAHAPAPAVRTSSSDSTSTAPLALILPTSLCAGQIARMIADRLNSESGGSLRAVTLPHTEGCGNSGGEPEELFMRTMAGYLAHPLVTRAMLLEHGCEKTHNDAFRQVLRQMKLPEHVYGFASIQLDGGIERVTAKALEFLQSQKDKPAAISAGLGLAGDFPTFLRAALHAVTEVHIERGGFVVIADGVDVSRATTTPNLRYGERAPGPGVHRMECPTNDLVEILTGLGATGVRLLLAFENRLLAPENPLVPTVQIAERGALPRNLENDVDLLVTPATRAEELSALVADVLNGHRVPRSRQLGNTAFQITRGYTGISL